MKNKYPVYTSFEIHYLRLILLAFPCFAAYLAYQTGANFLYAVAAVTAFIFVAVMVALSKFVTFQESGVILTSGLKQSYVIPWDRVSCCGIFSIKTLGVVHRQKYIYFSTKPVNLKELEESQILPKETADFIFLSYHEKIYELVSRLWNDPKTKLIR